MFDFSNCTEEELWKHVASHLKRNGIDTVLVGGGVVCVYTKGLYRSGDIDLIVYSGLMNKDKDLIMEQLGFKRQGKNFFREDCQFSVEFPSGPLGIGEDHNIVPSERDHDGQTIKLLSPTDSVKDRLASYIYYSADECLQQAVMIAKRTPINTDKVRKWCLKEKNGAAVWKEFLELIK